MATQTNDDAERYLLGATIAGRYEVEGLLAHGAMGAVVLARHVNLEEKVAIKFLRPELRREPAAIARFSRQSKVLARIKSDHVARVLDVGITLSAGPFMVMEYLQGTDLGDVLKREGPLPVERVIEIALQVCEALTVAHTAGITHGGLEPRKLFLARHGQFETLKVLGFGLSEDPGGSVADGSLAYMAPERIEDESKADHRADIWSLGVVLHELVTGRPVFEAQTSLETRSRILGEAPPELEGDDAVLPPSLRGIIARCLERDPDRRYQNVEELASALAPLASMHERFRGRSTGAFSRKLVEEQLALSKTQRFSLPAPDAPPPAPGELSSVLRDIGAALRWVARSTLQARVYERPLWLYAAVALASATAVAAVSRLGSVRWMSPSPVPITSEPLAPRERHAVRGVDAPAPPLVPSEAASGVRSEVDDPISSDVAGVSAPAAAPAVEKSAAQEPAARGAPPAERVSRRRHRARARAHEARESIEAPAAEQRAHGATKRTSRIRLVDEKLLTNRNGKREPNAPSEKAPRTAPQATRAPSLPEWLELMRDDSATP